MGVYSEPEALESRQNALARVQGYEGGSSGVMFDCLVQAIT
jgi:hypothetical protein